MDERHRWSFPELTPEFLRNQRPRHEPYEPEWSKVSGRGEMRCAECESPTPCLTGRLIDALLAAWDELAKHGVSAPKS